MPAAKLRSSNNLDAMMFGQNLVKADETNVSLDTFIRQAIGKEPVLPYSRAADSPIQWIQFLSSLDPQDLSGWPLYPKVPMQKCDKCVREFCSPINYRRHIRLHRRSLKIEKDSTKIRDLMGAFWDKLSVDEAKDVISFDTVMLEGVPGSAVVRALASFIRKPGFFSLPQSYVKAGAALLDLIQGRPSRFPISSTELFSILHDASEKTFLCPGTATSMQKFMFDGEPGKIGFEMKNLIACTSFLVEQKLIKECLVEKDAEALRCQKLLVEEEEAAQRRQFELLERKRLKKLRQKEQKAKEQVEVEDVDLKEDSSISVEVSESTSISHTPELSIVRSASTDEGCDNADNAEKAEIDMAYETSNSNDPQDFDHQHVQQGNSQQQGDGQQHGNGRQRAVANRRSQRSEPNSFRTGHVVPVSKLGAIQKRGNYRDLKTTPLANKSQRVWTRKTKIENERIGSNAGVRDTRDKQDLGGSRDLLIGSIPVTLAECSTSSQIKVDQCTLDHQPGQRNISSSSIQEKSVKIELVQSGTNKSKTKHWRPVGRRERRKREKIESVGESSNLIDDSCIPRNNSDGCSGLEGARSSEATEELHSTGKKLFSSHEVKAFLAQRWKEAITSDHVKLVLSPETELPECVENQDVQVTAHIPSESCNRSILGSAENRLAGTNGPERAKNGTSKHAKFKAKPERGYKLKRIPEQRNSS
ncbi:uncharacterized protein LOC113304262 isoform X2 [Papaver somniferum]|uniref:uncharacterized protein LOC113304262 isoform X2 n=1 Tax=Papaver somniferum TaxID=3469 RepID=UPI000E703A1B|nr:uncharacterized protein LOC113304262 isoform X2 [Papaver somniferum]